MDYHVPALLSQCMEGMAIDPTGVYVDVTFGGGGHARAIFNQLTTGKLLVFDQDADAKRNTEWFNDHLEDRSFTFIEANFRYLEKYLKFYGVTAIDGLIADLGVSFHQFDEADRGFSTRFDGLLDMRMNQKAGVSAREIVNEMNEPDLIHMLSSYGEIKNSRTLAQRIIAARIQRPIDTSAQLKEIASKVAPRGRELKYFAQLFQAIRIHVNDEMAAIKEMLEQATNALKPQGRLVVMSYHSLEDRLVKNYMNSGNFKGKLEKDFYGNVMRPLDPVNRKLIVPSEAEISENSRSRSAKLRIGEKRNGR